MASGKIRKKSGKLYVVLSFADGKGDRKEKWYSVEKECGKDAGIRAANKLLRDKIADYETTGIIASGKITLEAFLQTWLETKAPSIADSTKESYDLHIRIHINPKIGMLQLRDLNKVIVQDYFTTLANKGMSARQIQYVQAILRSAFNTAVEWQMMAMNPAVNIFKPEYRKDEKVVWSDEEAWTFLAVTFDHYLGLLFRLIMASGCRLGEALGLTWYNVCYDKSEIHIDRQLNKKLEFKPLKTKSSYRSVSLPAEIMDELKQHQADQGKMLDLSEIKNVANAVFLTKNLTLVDGRNALNIFKRLCKKATVRSTDIHSLRHLQATWLVSDNVDLKSIQNRLGHSRSQTTLDIYAKLFKKKQDDAVTAIGSHMYSRPATQTPAPQSQSFESDTSLKSNEDTKVISMEKYLSKKFC